MMYLAKINGAEHPLRFARFREDDYRYARRDTVTLVIETTHANAVALFSDPGDWSIIKRYDQEPDIVTDCTAYDTLCSIRDDMTGVLEVVMGKITDSEALAELREVLNG